MHGTHVQASKGMCRNGHPYTAENTYQREVGRLLGHKSTATSARYAHLAEMPNAAILAALAPT